MIKRTLHFGNPCYLSTRLEQLIVTYPESEQAQKSVPIEDIGVIILEDRQITISNALIDKLLSNNAAVITCNEQHLPTGLILSLDGHSEQNERFKRQIEASLPLKKNLWQQTVQAKITNQASLLNSRSVSVENMLYWAKEVSSGDKKNHEARAAAYYWKHLFQDGDFRRDRYGEAPNNLLNYGYAILRAICARALVGSGLLPTLGIFHSNKYNAYGLADDIMEPYRPFVDSVVCQIINNQKEIIELSKEMKKELLQIPALDVFIDGKRSPLMVAMSRTTNSVNDCFAGTSRKILYPAFAT
jgi:CRISP-associated protein Cas1